MSENLTATVNTSTENNSERAPAGGYRALAVITFLFAVGGLFLGLLSKLVDFFAHSTIFGAAGGALDGSLLGFLIHYVKTISEAGIGTYLKETFTSFDVSNITLLLSSVGVAIAAVLSLILMIASFCVGKTAKNCAMTSAVIAFLAYFGMFICNFYTGRLTSDTFEKSMFDIPTAIVSGVLLVCLWVAALARRKGLGLLNILLFVLTVLTGYAMCNTSSLFLQLGVLGGIDAIKSNIFFGSATLAFFVVLAFNVIASSVRLNAQKAYVFDTVRFGLLLITAVLAFISNGLETDWALFNTQLLSVILMLAAPLAAFLLSIVAAIVIANKANHNEIASDDLLRAYGGIPAQQPAAATAEAYTAPVGAETAQDIAKNVTVNVTPPAATEPQPPQNVTVNVSPAMYGQQPMGMPFYPMPYYVAPQPGMMPGAAPAQQPAPAPEAEAPAAPAPAPAPEPAKEEPMTEFERSMAALAKGIEPEAPAAPAPQPAPAPAPVFTQPAAAPVQQAMPSSVYDATQYTYDSFINGLTPQEKNEFGDLFIANKYGDLSYLPAYVIGGDNREFFSKVFIYVGRYRGHISTSLLDKLYLYVNSRA